MKAVILDAGEGKRLYPITKCISKGLVPVYDRPALMYHISFLAAMGISEAAVVVAPEHESVYRKFIEGIDTQGLNISLYVQKEGSGFLAAYASCIDFMQGNNILIVMGDCLYFIKDMDELKKQAEICFENDKVGIVLGQAKPDESIAFFEHTSDGEILSFNYRTSGSGELCPIGMHFVPKSLTYSVEAFILPSNTEADTAAVSNRLIQCGRLMLPRLSDGDDWFDIGTPEHLFQASTYVRSIYKEADNK